MNADGRSKGGAAERGEELPGAVNELPWSCRVAFKRGGPEAAHLGGASARTTQMEETSASECCEEQLLVYRWVRMVDGGLRVDS